MLSDERKVARRKRCRVGGGRRKLSEMLVGRSEGRGSIGVVRNTRSMYPQHQLLLIPGVRGSLESRIYLRVASIRGRGRGELRLILRRRVVLARGLLRIVLQVLRVY